MGSGPGTRHDCKRDRPEHKVTREAPSLSRKVHSTISVLPSTHRFPHTFPLPHFQAFPNSFLKDIVRAQYSTARREQGRQPGRLKSQVRHLLRLWMSPFTYQSLGVL